MYVLSLQFRAAAWSFFFVLIGALGVRSAGARGVDFRAVVADASAVATAALAIFVASAALFLAVGGAATLQRLRRWGDANPTLGAARVIAGGLVVVTGAGAAIVASAHFATHYRAAGWAALANGAVVAAALVASLALFVPAERLAARVLGVHQPPFAQVLAWTVLAVSIVLLAVVERTLRGAFVVATPVVVIQAATLRWPPHPPKVAEFVVTRAFIVGCLLLFYARVFGIPGAVG